MTDPLRFGRPPSPPEAPDRDRDARVEELLLTGLDHYFSGRHDLAVNVWTRVLFLDRGHARARAYIERARSAIAERLREGEELLHTGVAAFQRGDQAAARALLRSAVDRGAGGEEAMAVLQRLDRREATAPHVDPSVSDGRAARDAAAAPAAAAGGSGLTWIVTGITSGVLLAALILFSIGEDGTRWLGRNAPTAVPARVEEPIPVPAASELSIARARALRARGHLRDALVALSSVRYGDRFRPEADELRAEIQQELLAASTAVEPPAANAATVRNPD
jgi:hypothetical protein